MIRCLTHKRYKGVHKPMVPCPGCWWTWFVKHPETEIRLITEHI
jgi:hypothetical protein